MGPLMPLSTYDGRGWAYNRLADSNVETVVDVGPGAGTYSILARHLLWSARWIAVERYEPYVQRFMLGSLYDDVVVADVRDWKPELSDYLIIFGDVLEHLERQDAIDVLEFHKEHAAEIMVSAPIIYAPQGACEGNPYEEHLTHFHHDEFLDLLPGCDAFKGVQVGRYFWCRDQTE